MQRPGNTAWHVRAAQWNTESTASPAQLPSETYRQWGGRRGSAESRRQRIARGHSASHRRPAVSVDDTVSTSGSLPRRCCRGATLVLEDAAGLQPTWTLGDRDPAGGLSSPCFRSERPVGAGAGAAWVPDGRLGARPQAVRKCLFGSLLQWARDVLPGVGLTPLEGHCCHGSLTGTWRPRQALDLLPMPLAVSGREPGPGWVSGQLCRPQDWVLGAGGQNLGCEQGPVPTKGEHPAATGPSNTCR